MNGVVFVLLFVSFQGQLKPLIALCNTRKQMLWATTQTVPAATHVSVSQLDQNSIEVHACSL